MMSAARGDVARQADLAWTRGADPRVHGNGMIQLDLSPTTRLHVWGDPRIPRQATHTPVHDHTFGFYSTVVVGRLFNLRYDVEYALGMGLGTRHTHVVHVPVPREGEDTLLEPTGERVRARLRTVECHYAGGSYSEAPRDFHETFAVEPTATLMRKTNRVDGAARVLVPVGAAPDNDFFRQAHDLGLLWSIISETLR